VADDSAAWIEAVASARDEIQTGGFEQGVVGDVPGNVWQLVLCDPSQPLPHAKEFPDHLARRTLVVARECLDGAQAWSSGDVDPWACVRSALLDGGVVTRLPSVAERRDIALFGEISHRLASPADAVCRALASQLSDSAA
jgi:hypothetical protein